MNIDGVEESPVHTASHPLDNTPSFTQFKMRSAEILLSCPTAILNFARLYLLFSHTIKARVIAVTASSVRVTVSPTAVPRTSVPLLRCLKSSIFISSL